MTRTTIIAALPGELKPFLDANAKEGWVHERRGNVNLWRLTWPLGQGEWVAACAGAGQQAATRAFAAVEEDGPIDRVYSIGWVGALSNSYVSGKAYRVSTVIDVATGERFLTSCNGTGEAVPFQNEIWLVTSPKVANAAEKQRLSAAYNAGLVDMEAAAIARLAAMREIPFDCIKGVSDGLTDKLPDFNRFITADGRFQLARFVLFSILRPWHWPALIRMGENSKKASQAIRDLLLENLYKPGAASNKNGDSNLKR